MTEPINVRSLKHLTYGEKLLILRRESGITTISIANQLNTTEFAVEKVLESETR